LARLRRKLILSTPTVQLEQFPTLRVRWSTTSVGVMAVRRHGRLIQRQATSGLK